MFKFRRKAVNDVLNKFCLSVASLFKGQLYGLGKLLIGFAKICFERNPRFMNQRKAVPVLDRLLEFTSPVDNVIVLGYYLGL